MACYLRPESTTEALHALASAPYTVLAGGTDFYPARVGQPLTEPVLDISALDDLRGITASEQGYRIGALTTWSELLHAELPPCFAGLQQAAREIGGIQIQNTGTVGGNLCNASPAADGIPNLLALDAEVELLSAQGSRRLPLAGFILGNRRTARRPDELLSALHIPAASTGGHSAFLKLGARRYLVISIVMVAVVLTRDQDGVLQDVRLAVGACSETAQRLHRLEQVLCGQRYSPALLQRISPQLLEPLHPIDDVRGSARYRLSATVTLLQRALRQLLETTP